MNSMQHECSVTPSHYNFTVELITRYLYFFEWTLEWMLMNQFKTLRGDKFQKADLVVAFNAGILIYSSWRETIRELLLEKVPVVITSYRWIWIYPKVKMMLRKYLENGSRVLKWKYSMHFVWILCFSHNRILFILWPLDNLELWLMMCIKIILTLWHFKAKWSAM